MTAAPLRDIERLQRLAERRATEDDLAWIASRCRRFLDGEDPAAALGLTGPWRHQAELLRRDAAIRRVCRELLPDRSINAAAAEIAGAARGLRTPRDDSAAAGRDAAQRAAIRQRLVELLGSLDGVPGPRRIRQLLAGD